MGDLDWWLIERTAALLLGIFPDAPQIQIRFFFFFDIRYFSSQISHQKGPRVFFFEDIVAVVVVSYAETKFKLPLFLNVFFL